MHSEHGARVEWGGGGGGEDRERKKDCKPLSLSARRDKNSFSSCMHSLTLTLVKV